MMMLRGNDFLEEEKGRRDVIARDFCGDTVLQ